jgi:protein gp37
MNKTSIEWTDYTWNPVTGCNKISQGCKFCYAETMATRFWGDRKFTDVQMHPERLVELKKSHRKLDGKKVFVCDVSDLFHGKVSFDFIDSIFNEFYFLPNTTFQILTKRPERAVAFFEDKPNYVPLPNVWIGTSVENQEQADIRIPLLLQIPAAVRFLSCEPLIGEVNLVNSLSIFLSRSLTGKSANQFLRYDINAGKVMVFDLLHWVIAGGESGHGARPMHPYWVKSLRDQCAAANVPFFFKQWGEYISIRQAYESNINVTDKRPIQFGEGLFGDRTLVKLGKSKTGNLLDGKKHLAFPI